MSPSTQSGSSSFNPLPEINLERLTGAVRSVKEGFGFIAGDDGNDYFFHWSAMEKTGKNFREVVMQDRVSFNIARSEKGLRAICVRVI